MQRRVVVIGGVVGPVPVVPTKPASCDLPSDRPNTERKPSQKTNGDGDGRANACMRTHPTLSTPLHSPHQSGRRRCCYGCNDPIPMRPAGRVQVAAVCGLRACAGARCALVSASRFSSPPWNVEDTIMAPDDIHVVRTTHPLSSVFSAVIIRWMMDQGSAGRQLVYGAPALLTDGRLHQSSRRYIGQIDGFYK